MAGDIYGYGGIPTYMAQYQMADMMRQRQQRQQQQQQQRSGGMSPMQGYNMYSRFGSTGTGAGTGTGVGAGATEGGVEAGSAGAGSYASYIVPVLAAIAGQHLMSSNTDRQTDGHRTGDVFSGDFFTEPWMAYLSQQMGMKSPTAGEKTDAAINGIRDGKGGYSKLLSTVPETAFQWWDPLGNFADDFLSEKGGTVGKIASAGILPGTGLKKIAGMIGNIF